MDTKREGNLASILQLMVSSYQWFSWLYRCIDNEDVCRVGEVSGVHLCLIHHNHIMVFLAKMTLVSIEISFLFLAQVVLHDVTQCIGVIQCPLPWWWYNNQFPAFVEITTTLASATTCLKRSLFENPTGTYDFCDACAVRDIEIDWSLRIIDKMYTMNRNLLLNRIHFCKQ